MEERADNELVRSYLEDNDQESLDFIIKRYLKSVYNFVYGMIRIQDIAEDITQETFVKVWKYLKKFDQSKNFKTWVFTIAKNTTIDYTRKRKDLVFSSFENDDGGNVFEDSITDSEPLPNELFDASLQRNEVSDAINELPVLYRSVLALRFSEGLKFEEIAEIFEESVNTTKSRYRRAEVLLKKRLKRTKN